MPYLFGEGCEKTREVTYKILTKNEKNSADKKEQLSLNLHF